jgi:mono/diheme cytochrome c family protein
MKIKNTCLSILFLTNSSFVLAEDEAEVDAKHGKDVHAEHCYKCHTDDVYTRDERFVKSIDALGKQVVRCKDGNDVPWFDEDTDAVVQFLNQKYYKF